VYLKPAQIKVNKLIRRTSGKVLEFTEYGRNFIKKNKISPDGFVQAAFQLAYYKMKGEVRSTYESVQTKKFYHGRTECLRSVTKDMRKFVEHFVNEKISNDIKFKYLTSAIDQHSERMKDCQEGLGVDRHLLGLYEIVKNKVHRYPGYLVPEIFLDDSYGILSASVLSTSNCGGTALQLFGFGPVVANGLGIGYMILPDVLFVYVSSFVNEAEKYVYLLRESLIEMRDLVLATAGKYSSKL